MTPWATADFESRSECSLKNSGAWKYSLDPSTEILCLGFRLPYWAPGRTSLWYPEFTGIDIPPFADYDDLLELIEWVESGGLLEGHSAFFERSMWANILAPRYRFPAVAHEQWRCSQAKAAAYALPRKLGEVADVLQLTHQKTQGGMVIDDGTKTKQKTYKPRKPRKKEREAWQAAHGETPHPVVYWDTPDVLMNLFAYCRQDVLAEEELSASLDDLSPDETEIYLLDQTINQRGFQLDLTAVKTALILIGRETARLNKELEILTSGKVKKATQRAQMVAWFKTQGLELPDTQKATIDGLLESSRTLTPTATRGLQLVRTLGRSSTAKYRKMLDWAAPDGRVRGGLLYHGASTGRWSGSGPQPHNFPKGKPDGPGKDQETLWINLIAGKTAAYPDIMEALSEGLRGAITASKGKQLYVADFAQIEARVLLWLAQDEDGLDIFRRGESPYCAMGQEIYGHPISKTDGEKYALSKAAVLGLGFQMGAAKFVETAWVMAGVRLLEDLTCTKCGKPSCQHWKQKHYFQCDNPDDMTAVKVVDAYREKFWKVKQLWEDMSAAAIAAVLHNSTEVVNGITWQVERYEENDFLFCYLPSGRRLAYPFPEIHKKATPWGELRNSLTFEGVNPLNHQWQRQTTYGGSVVENATQAVARDLLAAALLRCEQSIYKPVLSVHDEILTEANIGEGSLDEFTALISECPDWAANCPISAESWVGQRYHK